MKRIAISLICLLAFIVLKSESCKKNTSAWSKSDCPFERMDWMKVSEGYNSKTIIDLAGKLEAAAKADASVLKGADASASADFSSSLKKAIDLSSSKSVEVSLEFYEAYVRQRTATCNIWKAMQDGTISSTTARSQGEQIFLAVSQEFAKVKANEEKKSQH